MNNYPLMIDLHNKKTVVVGGGNVAYRKIRPLLHAGAEVKVVSPEAIAEIIELSEQGQVNWVQKRFEVGDTWEAFLIIAATNDEKVNQAVARAAFPHQLLNVVNQPELGNFHTPSVLERGRLTLAVSTNGASPSLSRVIRDELSEMYDESYEAYVDFLFKCRERIKRESTSPEEKREQFKQLLDPKFKDPENRRKWLESWHAGNKAAQ